MAASGQAREAVERDLRDLGAALRTAAARPVAPLVANAVFGTTSKQGTVRPWLGLDKRRVSAPKVGDGPRVAAAVADVVAGDDSNERRRIESALLDLWARLRAVDRRAQSNRDRAAEAHESDRLFGPIDGPRGRARRSRELDELLASDLRPVSSINLTKQFELASELDPYCTRYVTRTADVLLHLAFGKGVKSAPDAWLDRIVVASGPAKSGRTRSILEALPQWVPGAVFLNVRPPVDARHSPLVDLADALDRSRRTNAEGFVVYVEGIDRHLGSVTPIAAALERLMVRPDGQRVYLVATLSDDRGNETDGKPRDRAALLDRDFLDPKSIRYSARLDHAELDRAASLFADMIDSGLLATGDLELLPERCSARDVLFARGESLLQKGLPTPEAATVRAVLDLTIVEPDGSTRESIRRTASLWIRTAGGSPGDDAIDAVIDKLIVPVARAYGLLNSVSDAQAGQEQRWQLFEPAREALLDSHTPHSDLAELLGDHEVGRLAAWYVGRGETDAAREVHRVGAARGIVESAVAAGRAEAARGDLAEARRWLTAASESGSSDAALLVQVIDVAEERVADPEPILTYCFSIPDAVPEMLLGLVHEALDEVATAVTFYRTAALRGDSDAMTELGAILMTEGSVDEARSLFEEATRLGHPTGMANLARLIEDDSGDPGEVRRLREAAALQGASGAMVDLAQMLWEDGDLDAAERWFRLAASKDPDIGTAGLGFVLLDKHDEDAGRYLNEAAERGSEQAESKLAELAERVRLATELASSSAEVPNAAVMFDAACLLSAGRRDEAIGLWRAAAALDDPSSLNALAVVFESVGRTDAAEALWRKAADLGNTNAQYNLANYYRERGVIADAVRYCEAAASAGHPMAMFNLGLFKHSSSDVSAAREWWSKAGEMGNLDALHNLAVLLLTEGQKKEALDALTKAALKDHLPSTNLLAELMFEEGSLEIAERLWTRAISLGSPAAMGSYSRALIVQGRIADGLSWARRAADAGNSEQALAIGLVNLAQSNRDDAVRWLEIAAEAGSPRAQTILGLISSTGVAADPDSDRWFRSAAESGDAPAAFYLGIRLIFAAEYAEGEQLLKRALSSADNDVRSQMMAELRRIADAGGTLIPSDIVARLLAADPQLANE